VCSFPFKEPAWSSGNISPPKAFQILRYVTPSDPPAERVRALVGRCHCGPKGERECCMIAAIPSAAAFAAVLHYADQQAGIV
jgi:hypothetical protein